MASPPAVALVLLLLVAAVDCPHGVVLLLAASVALLACSRGACCASLSVLSLICNSKSILFYFTILHLNIVVLFVQELAPTGIDQVRVHV